MMKSLIAGGLMAALAMVQAPAEAAVIYSIVQDGPTMVGPRAPAGWETAPYVTSLQVTVTDEAAANGFSFRITPPAGGSAPQVDGLLAISLSLSGPGGFSYNLANFLDRTTVQPGPLRTLSLMATAGGLLSGQVYGNNTGTDTRVLLDGTSLVTGSTNSDVLNQVCFLDNCTFTATQTRTATTVPEPASLAIFGAGLVGLAVSRRRAKAAAR